MPSSSLNGPMGAAEGYNGVTQGSTGALLGGDVQSPSSSVGKGSLRGSVVNEGLSQAIKSIMPALNPANATPEASQGSTGKQIGQEQESSIPRSPGGPGVSSVGSMQNLPQTLKSQGSSVKQGL